MRYFLIISLLFIGITVYGQTNTFPSDGNVGIGIVPPQQKLDVRGTSDFGDVSHTNYVRLENSSSNDYSLIRFNNSGSVGNLYLIGYGANHGTSPHSLALKALGTYGYLWFVTNGIERLRISPTGNIGIGTTTPDYKLDVLGTIRANEVKVATGWSDFVFEPDYDLPTLQEVENYIDKNGHLPDIPSAEEVKVDGISLGEMDAKLLQKIEELTLYVIGQNQKLEVQSQRLEEMQQENDELKAENLKQNELINSLIKKDEK